MSNHCCQKDVLHVMVQSVRLHQNYFSHGYVCDIMSN